MALPRDWNIQYCWTSEGSLSARDPRGQCPHCRNAVTFAIRAIEVVRIVDKRYPVTGYSIHMILKCNSASCAEISYVKTTVSESFQLNRGIDEFFIHPSRAIDAPHPAIPQHISEAWIEAQKAMEAGAPMAAAVMCRRVLYGAILDKGCKEHPLQEGLKELISTQRLPAVFDDWLQAIKDDGHDAAHPHRALEISSENVTETMEYTSELLRFLYIEPYEFQQRKSRNAPKH